MEKQQSAPQTAALILKFLKNELHESEKQEFEQWRAAHPDHEALVESFRNTKAVQEEINYFNSVNVNAGWETLTAKIAATPAKPFKWNKFLRYSAAAILLLSVGVGIYTYTVKNNQEIKIAGLEQVYDIMPGHSKATLSMSDGSSVNLTAATMQINGKDGSNINAKSGVLAFKNGNQQKGYNQLKTPKAGEYKMILPDGTKVWLNAASTLTFPGSFNQNERRVELNGEAYFEVAHNKALPFIVSFNQTEVEVLGTHFNINSYDKVSKTTLLEGAVKIREGKHQTILKPGEEANITDNRFEIVKVDTYKSIAWKEGIFYFNNDDLASILDQVARWYDVKIQYKGNTSSKKYSGNIRRQATLNQVLEMLNAVSGASFSLSERTVTVNSLP
ncbi:FecR family protein [Pedobacter nototheniae]|uniref:FecR family protein n=1 Tax=Pedobacter nototheniae TaxID=2488994 RepID=UPI00292D17DA|nr:FecR domain-containing protein [Pedobacter nototheniae]